VSELLLDPRLANTRRIFLRDFTLDAHIGIHLAERRGVQRLVLNIDVFVALAASTPRNDRIDEVVDYDFLLEIVRRRVDRGHINLQETLVDDLAREILSGREGRPGVVAVRVRSEKPDVYPGAAGVGVEVLRFRESA